MVDEIIKQVLLQVPLAAIVGIALWRVYTDGKADRAYLIDINQKQFVMLIELSGGKVSDHDETLHKRP